MSYRAAQYISYPEYLRSPYWRRLRECMLWLADYRCQVCKSEKDLEVHHASGYSCLGHERPEDLIVLCRRCHELYSRDEQEREAKI